MTTPVGVFLADDDAGFRAVYRKLFDRTEGFRVAGEAGHGVDALRLIRALEPDVALLDVQMPGGSGLEVARHVLGEVTGTRVIVLTTFDLDEYVHEALTLGASGFLLKNASPQEVLHAVRTVHAGHAMLAPEVTARLMGQFAPRRQRHAFTDVRLSEREVQVIRLVACGRSWAHAPGCSCWPAGWPCRSPPPGEYSYARKASRLVSMDPLCHPPPGGHVPLIRRQWRRRWIAAVAAAVLLTAAAALVVIAFPALAATTCPGCYGLRRLQPGLYAEPGLPPARRRQVIATVEEAGRRIGAFFGGRESSPDVLVCLSEDCYRRIGGGRERGIAVLNRAVMLSPRGADPVIATHELTHVELHARLGGADVPQWFDEGLAVLVSEDPRYLAPAGDRCLAVPHRPLPATLDDWLRAASENASLYAEAACQVSHWAGSNGGKEAVRALVERLSAGQAFPHISVPVPFGATVRPSLEKPS